jgi:biotin transporter BioY
MEQQSSGSLMPGQNAGFVVGWGTLALINAVLAQSHRRSGLGWFIASLFIGPFATLLLALWYRAPESVQSAHSPTAT